MEKSSLIYLKISLFFQKTGYIDNRCSLIRDSVMDILNILSLMFVGFVMYLCFIAIPTMVENRVEN